MLVYHRVHNMLLLIWTLSLSKWHSLCSSETKLKPSSELLRQFSPHQQPLRLVAMDIHIWQCVKTLYPW